MPGKLRAEAIEKEKEEARAANVLLQSLLHYMRDATPAARLEIMDKMRSEFCIHCGGMRPEVPTLRCPDCKSID